jgi:hypothetical protein
MIRADGLRNGYAAVTRTMGGCSPLLRWHLRKDCLAFNDAVTHEIPALAGGGVTGIVASSRSFGFPGVFAAAADIVAWKDGLREGFAMARAMGLRVLVIAPVPTFKFPVPECLAHLPPENCGIDRATLDRTRDPVVAGLKEVVSEFANARLWDPLPLFCNDQYCPSVQDGTIRYSDSNHLSVLGSRALAATSPYLNWVVSGAGYGSN